MLVKSFRGNRARKVEAAHDRLVKDIDQKHHKGTYEDSMYRDRGCTMANVTIAANGDTVYSY